MKKIVPHFLLSLLLLVGALPAWAIVQGDFEYTFGRDYATVTAFNGEGLCVVPDTIYYNGKAYYVNSISLKNNDKVTGVKTTSNNTHVSLNACNAVKTIELGGEFSFTPAEFQKFSNTKYSLISVRLSNMTVENLTISGSGVTVSQGYSNKDDKSTFLDIENLTIDCPYVTFGDNYHDGIANIRLTKNVKYIARNIFLSSALEMESQDFECLVGGVFATRKLDEVYYKDIFGAAFYNAEIKVVNASPTGGYPKDAKWIGTLNLPDNITEFKHEDKKVWPDKVVGAGLKSVSYALPFYSVPDLFYDFNGDGKMGFVAYDGSWDKTYYLFENSKKQQEVKYVSQSRTEPCYRVVDLNNSGNLVVALDWWNTYRLGADYSMEKMDFPKFLTIADYDNDGRIDLLAHDDKSVAYRQLSDGTFVKNIFNLTNNKEDVYTVQAESDGNWINSLPSLDQGWMIDGTPPSFNTISLVSDLTKDGMPELVGYDGVMYYLSDNNYYVSSEVGQIFQCDLDGNGVLDYVLFDEKEETVYLMMYGSEGKYTSKTLVTNGVISNVYCRDFDRDGDIDILLPMDYTTSSGYSFLMFYRNDGNGVFKKKEVAFQEELRFGGCQDIDGDGLYEIWGETDNADYGIYRIDIQDDFTASASLLLSKTHADFDEDVHRFIVGDFDNDGYMNYIYPASGFTCSLIEENKNMAPKVMAKPTAYYDSRSGRVRIQWTAGEDTETSACDLTYELRIGTAPGKGDILNAASLADGRRRTLREGNMGRNLTTLFNPVQLTPGATYYISVQAIDAGGLGGPWSEEFVYEHEIDKVVFTANRNRISTADTLLLETVARPEAKYVWNVGGGTIIKDEGSRIQVVFNNAGNKTLGLTVEYGGKQLVAENKEISVLPYDEIDVSDDSVHYGVCADFNGDGYADSFSIKMYTNDGQGNFTLVPKTFNSDLSGALYGIFDFNKDGYLDFMIDSKKGNIFYNTGDADLDFEYELKDITIDGEKSNIVYLGDFRMDCNNDGYPESVDFGVNGCFMLNKGDNVSYVELTKFKLENFFDVNHDGFPDFLIEPDRSSDGSYYDTYVLVKDSTAMHNYLEPQLIFRYPRELGEFIEIGEHLFADLNNDGLVDLAVLDRAQHLLRVVPGVTMEQWPATEYIEIPLKGDYDFSLRSSWRLRDWDNNGFQDVMFQISGDNVISGTDYYLAMLFYPNFEVDFINLPTSATEPFLPIANGRYPQVGDSYNSELIVGYCDNQAPEKPENVMAKQTKEGLLITWNDAVDDHTPGVLMRYNFSVKKKGATGPGSFVISPMNALNDKATVISSYLYATTPQRIVPLSCLEAGVTYEVQVQAIDLMNAVSPMTAPVEVTISADGYVEAPEKVVVGKDVELKYVGTAADSYSIELDGGTLVTDKGNGTFVAKWATDGVKQIVLTAGTNQIRSAVTVVKAADVAFEVPAEVFTNAPLKVRVPAVFSDLTMDCGFRSESDKVEISYNRGDSIAEFLFKEVGSFEVESYCEDALLGNTYTGSVAVVAEMPVAEIARVNVDGETGVYRVEWNAGGMSELVDRVVVGKETSRVNNYLVLDTVPVSEGRYLDFSSTPKVRSERYVIRLLAKNGQESYESAAHKPLHVMLNMAVGGGYNLMWNAYEGLEVDTYSILRGSSADAMEKIAEVAGSQLNYTDLSAPEGESFYAVSFVPVEKPQTRSVAGELRSNVISTANALPTVGVSSLYIRSLESEMELVAEQPQLHLFVEVLPQAATFTNVVWTIVSGSELATINQNGLLKANGTGNGDIVVRATALDGSGVYAEVTIRCEDAGSGVDEIDDYDSEDGWGLNIAYDRGAETVTVSGWNPNEPAIVYVVSTGGQVMDIARIFAPAYAIDCSRFGSGVYVVKVVNGNTAAATKFIWKR